MDIDASIINKMRNSGPILPIDVHKQIGLNVLFTTAHLSEMVRGKLIKMTKLKKGSSPFYYLPDKQADVESLSHHLKPPEKAVFDLIKSKKVIKDSIQGQSIKVGLKNIPDFAVPLNVSFNGKKELFWKYFLVDDSEVGPLVKEIIAVKPKPQPVLPKPVEKKPEVKSVEQPVVKKEEVVAQPIKPVVKNELVRVEQPKVVEKPKEPVIVKKDPVIEGQKTIPQVQPVQQDEEPRKLTLSERMAAEQDSFFASVKGFFDDKEIVINDYTVVKKESEIDFSIHVPSAIGVSEFFCRAKNKKRISDGDLSTAFVTGMIRKLPVLFVSPGDLTKRASQMIGNEFKNQVFFKKV